MICKQCGTVLKNGDKYCGKCDIYNESHIEDSCKLIPLFFKSPITAISEAHAKNEVSAIVGLVLILITGLLGMIFSAGLFMKLKSALGFAGSLIYQLGFQGSFPYGKMLGYSLLGEVIVISTLFLALWFVGRVICKSEQGVDKWFSLAVIGQIPAVAGLIIAMVITFISVPIALIVFTVGWLISAICYYVGFREATQIPENKSIYYIGIVYAAAATIQLILTKII